MSIQNELRAERQGGGSKSGSTASLGLSRKGLVSPETLLSSQSAVISDLEAELLAKSQQLVNMQLQAQRHQTELEQERADASEQVAALKRNNESLTKEVCLFACLLA